MLIVLSTFEADHFHSIIVNDENISSRIEGKEEAGSVAGTCIYAEKGTRIPHFLVHTWKFFVLQHSFPFKKVKTT